MTELIQEIFREISQEPLAFAAEVIQFLLLIAILRFLLPRIVGTDLKERRRRIAADMERADNADAAYAEAEKEATALVAAAREEAGKAVEAAGMMTQEERRAGLDQAEQEAKAILLQARQSVEAEKGRVTGEASEQLLTLITLVTRRYIEEALTENERRAVTQQLIVASLKEMEKPAPLQ